VFLQGEVVWAYFTQANSLLFKAGPMGHPAELCVMNDPAALINPTWLAEVAHKLYELKGTTPENPQLLAIANHLAKETTRCFGLYIPPSITQGIDCTLTTTFVHRPHLPGGVLFRSLVPAVAGKTDIPFCFPLPAKYWPARLERWWLDGAKK